MTYAEGMATAMAGAMPSRERLKEREFARGYDAGRKAIKEAAPYRNAPIPDTDQMSKPRRLPKEKSS